MNQFYLIQKSQETQIFLGVGKKCVFLQSPFFSTISSVADFFFLD